TSVGNIVGTAIAGAFVDHNWGLSFIVPGLICIGTALMVFLFLIPSESLLVMMEFLVQLIKSKTEPGDVGLQVSMNLLEEDETTDDCESQKEPEKSESTEQAIG